MQLFPLPAERALNFEPYTLHCRGYKVYIIMQIRALCLLAAEQAHAAIEALTRLVRHASALRLRRQPGSNRVRTIAVSIGAGS